MFEKLKQKIKDAIDPRGPIGQWLSPAVVYKERQGLPTTNPYVMRVQLETSAAVEKAIAPSRFVKMGEEQAPAERVRLLSAFIEEVWAPVFAAVESTDYHALMFARPEQVGWTVTQRERSAYCDCTKARFSKDADGEFRHEACGRARKHLTDEEFVELVQAQQMIPSDEYFNGYYDTIPGNDPVILDGEVLKGQPVYDSEGRMVHDGTIRGGTMITGGRREYEQKTRGMVHWDKGFVREREAALAEEASRPVRNVQREMERLKEQLPMRRLVPNPRYDRMSGV